MRAAVLMGFGGVDQLEVREVPEPTTGPGAIKVRVVATSINPIDWKLREGAKRPGMALALPAILGRDASGEVVEVGSGVRRFRAGMRVVGPVMGGYGERVVAEDAAWAESTGSSRWTTRSTAGDCPRSTGSRTRSARRSRRSCSIACVEAA